MAKVLVRYYSSYGHVEVMARAVAEGARSAGARADVRRVPETVPAEITKSAHFKLDQEAPVADVEELRGYDAIVVGSGTRFGRLSGQLAAFLDAAGPLWVEGALVGKVGSAFTSSSSQHGGNEMTLLSILTNLLHFGMVIVGLPYSFRGLLETDEVAGGTPYGASTIAGADGTRTPSQVELDGARFQGRRVAELAMKLTH